MRKIVYDFAMTLDGFICREDGSYDGFVAKGDHAAEYLERLQKYDAVLMGRNTYEFGYQFGLKPGERAYPHMEHYIFSRTLQFDSEQLNVVPPDRIDMVRALKNSDGGVIYVCGGGQLAGALLDRGLIDQLTIKLNPVVFGAGVNAFGTSSAGFDATLIDSKQYDNGVMLLQYDVHYSS